MKRLLIITALSLFSILRFSSPVLAFPKTVILLRHAEKPEKGRHLNDQGWERAEALETFFLEDPEITQYGPIAGVYAMGPTGRKGTMRSVETLEGTAATLRLPLHSEYRRGDIEDLVKSINKNPKYDGKTVVIAWQHGELTEVAKEFGYKQPPKWDDDVYDDLWVMQFNEKGKIKTFSQVPQQVLEEDTNNIKRYREGNPSKKDIKKHPRRCAWLEEIIPDWE